MTTVHLRDIELYYEVSGEGQPLVFIHGLGSSARDWQFQVPVFCNRYQVITFDLRGHGKSSKPAGPYSIPLFADDTAALMKHLGLGPAHVVGISLGGMVALQLALSAPAQIASLTVVNAGPEFIVRTFGQRLQIWQRQAIVRLLGMQKMGEVLSQRLFPKPEQEELRAMFVERWAENDPRAYRDAMMAIVGWSVTDQLESIRCPTLVMSAEQDYTPVSMKEAYVVRMPHAELVVIPDSRHATPVERPDEFNAALTAFLAKQA
jgi:pimeloyl-ACP methyl ester carboxylesterase